MVEGAQRACGYIALRLVVTRLILGLKLAEYRFLVVEHSA